MQLEPEKLQKRKEQAGQALRHLGSQLQKINLGNLIDKMEQDQGLADSLEQFNARMKEEVERQEIRREAEGRAIEVIQTHMDEFLEQYPHATYEEWIQDLHPENANQGKLLNDIQQIDERFYVFGSDHRRLWNKAIAEKDAHRIVEARTQVWGNTQGSGADGEPIDLLSDGVEFQSAANCSSEKLQQDTTSSAIIDDDFDFFAASALNATDSGPMGDNNAVDNNDQCEDLIKF